MEKILMLPIAAGLILTGCGDDTSKKTVQATNAPAKYDSGNPLTAPADYVGALAQAKKYADKTIDVSYLNQAVQQFNVQEGRYPKILEELTPNYVAKIPDAPIGYKIDYDATKGEVKVVPQ
jgi:hypothetical protein